MISSMVGFTQRKSMSAVVWPTGGGVGCEGNVGVVGDDTRHDCGKTCFAWGCMHYLVLPRCLFSCCFASRGVPGQAGSWAGVTGAEGNTTNGHLPTQSWTAS